MEAEGWELTGAFTPTVFTFQKEEAAKTVVADLIDERQEGNYH